MGSEEHEMRELASRHWVAALAGAFGAALAGSASAADLTVGAFGGVWEQSLRKCTIEPWTKKTGKTVDVVLGAPVQWLNQIAASPQKPPFDVLYLPTENAFDAIQRGMADKLPTEKVPNIALLEPHFQTIGDGSGVVHNYGAMGLIYNPETVKNPPKDWKAFVDGTLAGKWKATMPNINYPSAGLTISVWRFADLYGGNIDNIQPGIDIVKKMRASGNMGLWSDPNQVLNSLKSGDIDIAMYWDGRAWAFIDDGNKEFKYYNPEPGAVTGMTWIQKIKNANDLAYDYINFALSTEAQSCFGSAIRYGVANKSATFDPKVAHQITKYKELVFPPFKDIPSRQAKWVETWNKEVR
jgi:putative spermidine/putrescine transport system substrate-binding protein